ncbi:TonB-dependent receptor [Catenovulum sp. 2E275]|uniref:TonB-dependent receptor n=1 Tax=Catenovulum sp. 2E275 TaxID=2980497 RepID=UPI0021CF7CC5|nr:TonB-dependent receptor [Catenovulum sp. 2E275]MCU4676553.1 TonB-dependent receptor [Catenovulum sp. 2E275]
MNTGHFTLLFKPNVIKQLSIPLLMVRRLFNPLKAHAVFNLCLAIGLLFKLAINPLQANEASSEITFHIEAGDAAMTLLKFAEQADVSFAVPMSELTGIQTKPLSGKYSIVQALKLLLADSQLHAFLDSQHRIVLSKKVVKSHDAKPSYLADTNIETIKIKGFRSSLSQALITKRANINLSESISAEDIGKFPDLNIADSLQRLPGVAITRESGEGRRITLRGLGPDFTRVTLNGMEIPTTTDELDSSVSELNGGRAFEFNVFASELFNRVDIQKSPTPAIEEGGIAGTVNLYSAKPLDKPGFTLATSLQTSYNPVSNAYDPRGAFLISNTFADQKFGALLSFAYAKRTVAQEGFGTVGWQTPVENNMTYADTTQLQISGDIAEQDCYLNSQQVAAVNCLWTPRLPRPDFFGNHQTRLGITSSLQYQPVSTVQLTLDFLHAQLKNNRDFYNYYQMYRNYFNQITPLQISVNKNGKQVDAGLFDGLTGRIESRDTQSLTQFNQYALSGQWQLNESTQMNGILGLAESHFRREELRHIMDTLQTHQFAFDFTQDSNSPEVTYFYNYNDPAAYNFKSFDGATEINKQNITAKLNFNYTGQIWHLQTGVAYNQRTVTNLGYSLPMFEADSAVGLTKDFPKSDYGQYFNGEVFPFIVADFVKVKQARGKLNWIEQIQGNSEIVETTKAAFIELEHQHEFKEVYLTTNLGFRLVKTDADSTGYTTLYSQIEAVNAEHSYTNFLPALNVALETPQDIIFRLGATQTMTRPSLTKLNPSNPSFRYVEGLVAVGNPYLDPYKSSNFDFAMEWYFQPEALVAVNFFYKRIKDYIRSSKEDKMVDPIYFDSIRADSNFDPSISVDPFTQAYTHVSSENGEGTKINGIEFSYQQPFHFLLGKWANTGLTANYTQVHSGENVGVSENSHNLTLYYEEPAFGARISVNSRGDYFTEIPGYTGNKQNATQGSTYVDFSSFYNLTKQTTLIFEIGNLTDEYSRHYVTGDGSMNLMREYNHTGRQFVLGVRYNQ